MRSISYEWLQTISNIFFIVNIGLVFFMILFERKNSSSMWAWMLILFFIPILGFVLYFVFGQPFKKRKLQHPAPYYHPEFRQLAAAQLDSLKEGSFSHRTSVTKRFEDVLRMNTASQEAPLSQNNRLEVYIDGEKLFHVLFQDIEAAEHHIHLEFYEVENDGLGQQLVQKLTEKAKQGVAVLFLYDDIGAKKLPRHFFDALHEAGGKTAAFLPTFIPFFSSHVNYRNHRKVAVIDGVSGFIGGFNIGDKYLGKNKKLGYWRDTHFRLQGSAVHSLQHRFLLDWNHASHSYPVKGNSTHFPVPRQEGGTAVQIISSGPNLPLNYMENTMLKLIGRAEKTIYLQTPYFVPSDAVLKALRVAALGGTDVRIMVPDKPDHPFVHAGTLSFVHELLPAGVKVYMYANGFIHAKSLAIDGQVFTTGSTNADSRSFSLNFETDLLIYDEQWARHMTEVFRQDMKKSQQLTLEFFEQQSMYQRAKQRVARLLAPLL